MALARQRPQRDVARRSWPCVPPLSSHARRGHVAQRECGRTVGLAFSLCQRVVCPIAPTSECPSSSLFYTLSGRPSHVVFLWEGRSARRDGTGTCHGAI